MAIKILCILGFHKWKYNLEKINYSRPNSHSVNIHQVPSSLSISTDARICTKCYKKQIMRPIHGDWIVYPLNKEQLRDRNLETILKY